MIPLEWKKKAVEIGERNRPEAQPNFDSGADDEWYDRLIDELSDEVESIVEWDNFTEKEQEQLKDVIRTYIEGGTIIPEYFEKDSSVEPVTYSEMKEYKRKMNLARINEICDKLKSDIVVPIADSASPLAQLMYTSVRKAIEEIKEITKEL